MFLIFICIPPPLPPALSHHEARENRRRCQSTGVVDGASLVASQEKAGEGNGGGADAGANLVMSLTRAQEARDNMGVRVRATEAERQALELELRKVMVRSCNCCDD